MGLFLSDRICLMERCLRSLFVVVCLSFSLVTAQVPGEFPHLQVTDLQGTTLPPAGGPWDSSAVFAAASGLPLEAQFSYASPGQSNDNVLYGLLVSSFDTPYPTTFDPAVTPPPLFTMPPLLLIIPGIPTLNANGYGSILIHVPSGIYGIELYLQGVTYDITSSPKLRLSNGVTMPIVLPDYNVAVSFLRDPVEQDDGELDSVIATVGALRFETMEDLKPLGLQDPPYATGEDLGLGEIRFLPVLHNEGDEPANPMARPVTSLPQAINLTFDTIEVDSTAGFPIRGRLLIAQGGANLWAKKTNGGYDPPNAEVVLYDDITDTEFLNCERLALGSNQATGNHAAGDIIVGDYTSLTTSGARSRTRVSLDVSNRDYPHVVIPPVTFDGGPGVGVVTRDHDLFSFEQMVNGVQGFMVLDRVTQTWRVLEETKRNDSLGRWDPMIHVAPDRRSFVAILRVPGGLFNWDNNPDQIWVFRLDGLDWPATGTPDWQIIPESVPNPQVPNDFGVRSRRVWAPFVTIMNTDPEDFVLYVGLAYKWKPENAQGTGFPGDQDAAGSPAEWVREELIVRDLIECPLTPPGSSKTPPTMPRLFMPTGPGGDFPPSGTGYYIERFDPQPLLSPDRSMMMLAAGDKEDREDMYVIRNVTVLPNADVSRLCVNASGYTGKRTIRAIEPGGHGRGQRAAFSPDQSVIAWVTPAGTSAFVEWLAIARTSGVDQGQVGQVYEDPPNSTVFKENGVYQSNRIVNGLYFLDNDRLLFRMGRNPADCPFPTADTGALIEPVFDVFLYTISTDTMVNLTQSGSGSMVTGFESFGRINPAGHFSDPTGAYHYIVRAGLSGVTSPLSAVPIVNIIGVDRQAGVLFDVTGVEFASGSGISDLRLPQQEQDYLPYSATPSMQYTEGAGVQDSRMYLTAHHVASDGTDTATDEISVFNMAMPFITISVTSDSPAGGHITNLQPSPHANLVAFARTDTADPLANNQHPFVVDLDAFLYERDLVPYMQVGGQQIGRVMDGSFHFIPPLGTAPSALVFSMGYQALPSGIAHVAVPAYYPLASVSDPLVEPEPVLIGLVNTGLLAQDFRFYLPSAGGYTEELTSP